MIEQVLFQNGVTLAGGGPFYVEDLHKALSLAPHPVAADGGANRMMALDIVPEAVIGDMDSMLGKIPEKTRIMALTEQETTDFGKCLAHVDAPFFIGVGFLGGRVDHTLAALSVLLTHAARRVVLLGDEDVAFIAPPNWRITLEPEARVSFFPLVPCLGVSSDGLRWPIDGLAMTAAGQIGTSNEAVAARVSATFDRAGAVTILPKQYLEAVLASLGIGQA